MQLILIAADIINYIHGTDQTGYRNRTVTIGSTTAEWRLGDIVNSSPRQQSSSPANYYHKKSPDGYLDATYLAYTQTSSYLSRGMSYIGANDGMLHAFKHGKLEQSWSGKGSTDQARLSNPDTTTPLGSEVWAFIPKHALPYLTILCQQGLLSFILCGCPQHYSQTRVLGEMTMIQKQQTEAVGGLS